MRQKAYSRGVVLWIDDNFAYDEFFQDGTDIDAWDRTFGPNTENRVYRLLGLELITAISHDDAVETVQELLTRENQDTYIIAVVDLMLPKNNASIDAADTKWGIRVARFLRKRGIPFYFLSGRGGAATEDLALEGLASVPYFRKLADNRGLTMPRELSSLILNEFRNIISWISLADFDAKLSPARRLPPTENGKAVEREAGDKAMRHFPFFGSFRDFVERWEARPLRRQGLTLVLRSPQDHCERFVVQCLLVALSQLLRRADDASVMLSYFQAQERSAIARAEQTFRHRAADHILALRVWPDQLEPEELAPLTRSRRGITVFIVPNDESADRFLDVLPRHSRTIYDDLPTIRKGESTAREELIRRSFGFVFQQTRLPLKNRGDSTLGQLYIDHPEIATNPVNWAGLMEAENVAVALSDPFEILYELYRAADTLRHSLDEDARHSLAHAEPLPFKNLICVADEVLMGDAHNDVSEAERQRWRRRALDLWLSKSWYFPHGLTDRHCNTCRDCGRCGGKPDVTQERQREAAAWEDHCLQVAVELVSQLGPIEEDVHYTDWEHQLQSATVFLSHQGVKAAAEGKEDPNFSGLEFLRWPHTRYPMPAALSRKLKESGRYLWLQSDHLELVRVLPSGNRAYRNLDSLLVEYTTRLEWMHRVAPHLPEGWRQSVQLLSRLIDSGDTSALHWRLRTGKPDIKSRERFHEVWDALLGLLRNASTVSTTYHFLLAQQPLGEDKDGLRHVLTSASGYGTLHGKIRGLRHLARTEGMRFLPRATPGWTGSLIKLPAYVQLIEEQIRCSQGYNNAPDWAERLQEIVSTVMGLMEELGGLDLSPKDPLGDPSLSEGQINRVLTTLESWEEHLHNSSWYPYPTKGKHKRPVPGLESTAALPIRALPSLYGTKADYLWHSLDMVNDLRQALLPFRSWDGYPLLATLGDVRNVNKDTAPQVSAPVLETVLQLFVWGIEGIAAQLKFCLLALGEQELADAIALETIELATLPALDPSRAEELQRVFRVDRHEDGRYELFGLGIPGAGNVGAHVYHCNRQVMQYVPKD
jgi:hypothetical protein